MGRRRGALPVLPRLGSARQPIGVLATGPASVHRALLFGQLTEDLVYFTRDTALDEDTRARFAARGIRVIDDPVDGVVQTEDGGNAGVRLADDQVLARRVLAVATTMREPELMR